jgi:hypothetical protein
VGKSIIDTSGITRVGLDLAKRVFRIHAVDATGSIVIAARSIAEGTSPVFGVAPSAVFTEWCRSFEALPSRMRDSGRDRDPAGCEVRIVSRGVV